MSQISIRIDENLRKQTDEILSELGLNLSSAFNIFARLIVRSRGIPFPLTLSNPKTTNRQEAMSELFAFAETNSEKIPEDYKWNRDDCYDR